jgi:hypothetical protein
VWFRELFPLSNAWRHWSSEILHFGSNSANCSFGRVCGFIEILPLESARQPYGRFYKEAFVISHSIHRLSQKTFRRKNTPLKNSLLI